MVKLLRRRRRETDTVLSLELAHEVEAYLRGEHAEFARRQGWPVHPASHVNLLAHGTYEGVRELAGRPVPRPGRPARSWEEAAALLARALLSLAPTPERLGELQSTRLVPLELRVFAEEGGMSPRRLVELGAAALFAPERAPSLDCV